ncbi:MAG: hypothetical protein WCT04_20910 [Planctomycetota bacterium]
MTQNLSAVMLLIASTAFGLTHAADTLLNPEELPRTTYKGVTIFRYADQNWTEIDPAVILSLNNTALKEVCFEGKFESFVGALGLKLTGVDGKIFFEELAKRKLAPEMKALDNVWICGTIQPAKTGRGLELIIFDIAKLQPDVDRFMTKFNALEKEQDANGLIELGKKLELSAKKSGIGGLNMPGFDRINTLRDKCWNLAISIKEKTRKPNDSNACYEIAALYRDLIKRTPLYRQWVLKTLEIDPDHSSAGRDAERAFNMIRVGDKWISKDEYLRTQEIQELASKELEAKTKREQAQQTAQQIQESNERTVRLIELQVALRPTEGQGRGGAIQTLGERIQASLDQGFALTGIDILTNINDPSSISPGLEFAANNRYSEVRKLVYGSLVWRAAQNDVNSPMAYDVLARALKKEKTKEPAQAAANALAETGGKNAVNTLVAGLESIEPAVCESLIDGLKKLTHVQHQKKDEWIAWWNESKTQLPANAFMNSAIIK